MGEISEQRMTRPNAQVTIGDYTATNTPHTGTVESASRRSHHGHYGDQWRHSCSCGIDQIYATRSMADKEAAQHMQSVLIPSLDPNGPKAWKLDPALNPRHWRNCVARQKENRLTGKTGQGWAYGLDPATHGKPYSVT